LTEDRVYKALAEIVGPDYVSNRPEELYIYSYDPGVAGPLRPDYVVMPKTTEEVQRIVKLAYEEGIPVVPMGSGLTLTGLTVPIKGGIVVDLRRMDRIIEVNERARYAVIEAGVTHGQLKAYLERHHPKLKHSLPDAPPSATVAGNVLIHGQGRLSQQYGFSSDMVNGLEVVLPNGEVCRLGSCAVSPYWFSRAPLPDLIGLFIGWLGTTGIVTKLSIKLYPRKRLRDVEVFVTEDPELVPEVVYRVVDTEMAEDVDVWAQPYPPIYAGLQHTSIYITGDDEEELEFKRRLIWRALRDIIDSREGGFMMLTPDMKSTLLATPQPSVARIADVKKGGGFSYVGAIIPVEKFPEAYERGIEVSERHGIGTYSFMARVVGRGHAMMFAWSYPFNRADPESVERARRALDETDKLALELGGIPWKPGVHGQRLIMERMDRVALKLMREVRRLLDPKGIMNPGNWEESP